MTNGRRAESELIQSETEPCNVFLSAAEVIARYGWGRTKGYRVLRSEGFPRAICGDRYRLDTLIAWENAQLSEPRPPAEVAILPPRKRMRTA